MNAKRLLLIIIIVLSPNFIFAQKNSIIKLLNKGEYQQFYEKLSTTYTDTNDINRIELLALYYKDTKNPETNACLAYYYANKFNQSQGREIISLNEICKQELSLVYKTKDIESLEQFIQCFHEEKKYVKEAERLLEQLSFEKTQMFNTIEAYEKYIERHPNAIQANLARQAIDEIISIQILESEDIEKLEFFVKTTTNEKYKQQAYKEIDRISFQNTLEENTASKYEEYIKRFPNGVYIKLAKEKLNDALYNDVITRCNLTTMISFVKNNTDHPKRLQIIEKLKTASLKQLSIEGLKTVLEVEYDSVLVRKFIKSYLSDPTKANIATITEAFPEYKNTNTVQTAKKLNEDYNYIIRKATINNNDLKNHRGLFFKKNNSLTKKLLEKYIAQQKNSKKTDDRLESELTLNYQQSKKLPLILIDKEFEEKDLNLKPTNVFSAHSKNGYLAESSRKNEDIYIVKTNEVGISDTILLPSTINTRFNETSPVLSADGKTLFFSSNAGVNYGGLDIYVSHREDTTINDNWSTPILLGDNVNTSQNDYILSFNNYKMVIANDDTTTKRTLLIKEGLEFEDAYVLDKKGNFLSQEVLVIDSATLDTITIVKSNENGYVSFLKPAQPYYLYAYKSGYMSFFSQDNSQIVLQNIEDLFESKQFYLLDSPFSDKKLTEITPKGKREFEYLAESLKQIDYVATISVHVHSVNKNEKAQEISGKQVKIITDILLKSGVSKDKIIVASYANKSPLIGWEGKNRIEIGFLLEK